jgi:hypothetical protein
MASPYPGANKLSIRVISGKLETDADVFPLLKQVPEPRVSKSIDFGHDVLDKNVSNLSHDEVDKMYAEVRGEEKRGTVMFSAHRAV